MRKSFEHQLEDLNQDLLKLGSMVEERIHKAITALKNKNDELAQQVVENDDEIDDYQMEIEQECINLTALQQPVAKDLRRINMVSKMATDLERIADLAQNIAEIALELSASDYVKPLVDLPKMGEIAQEMIHDALDAFVNSNADKAKEVAQRDSKINDLDEQILRELLTYMVEDPKTVQQSNDLIFVSRYLERIGDHVTNICEDIVYIITAERVSY
ncbi:phosphate signaling complex protein PhoU [Halanaerobacter jeridensis]|uniref:Phosphate-specific transport system accessory protein PhoU n=1 Tax=Halanaerobacter jeridensis TaxID=706427 RepID=A0A938XQ35_9FIRM|nr:phosphate signaling complex protein PhoU [Halanaerobacter jeridensis]MBM7555464.1 phosphate transport system protein [Halanaerobacter jeridensis]